MWPLKVRLYCEVEKSTSHFSFILLRDWVCISQYSSILVSLLFVHCCNTLCISKLLLSAHHNCSILLHNTFPASWSQRNFPSLNYRGSSLSWTYIERLMFFQSTNIGLHLIALPLIWMKGPAIWTIAVISIAVCNASIMFFADGAGDIP